MRPIETILSENVLWPPVNVCEILQSDIITFIRVMDFFVFRIYLQGPLQRHAFPFLLPHSLTSICYSYRRNLIPSFQNWCLRSSCHRLGLLALLSLACSRAVSSSFSRCIASPPPPSPLHHLRLVSRGLSVTKAF